MGLHIKSSWRRTSVTVVPLVFLALVLLVSGIGKAWAGTVAGETEFFDVLFRSFWGPTMSFLIAELLPWAEIILALLLLSSVFPRIAATLSLPLIAGFIANNAYAISQGVAEYPECGYCFGVLEQLLGNPSPVQSLSIDIAMFVAALIVVFIHPAGFFRLRPKMEEISPKSRPRVAVAALLLGGFGVHRFYLRKFGTAVVMLILVILGFVTLGVYGSDVGFPFLAVVAAWALADFVVALTGVMEDKEGKPIKNWKW